MAKTQQYKDLLGEELLVPETKKLWIFRWWGVLLLVVFGAALAFGIVIARETVFYLNQLNSGNYGSFKNYIIQADGYGRVGTQVSRRDVETFDDPYYGDPESGLVIVEFGDFQCPNTQANYAAIKKLLSDFGPDIKFIYRDLPIISSHEFAMIGALAANCANDQNAFWPMHDLLFERQNAWKTNEDLIGYADELGLEHSQFSECLTSEKYKGEVLNDISDAIRFEVKGTPTFFINGVRISGMISYDTFKGLVEAYKEGK